MLQMGGNTPRALFAVYLFCLRDMTEIFYEFVPKNSLQDSIDFMTSTSRDKAWRHISNFD